MPFHCRECDSEEVQVQDWVNPNTGRADVSFDTNTTDTWCKLCCEADHGIVYKDDPLNYSPLEWEYKEQ